MKMIKYVFLFFLISIVVNAQNKNRRFIDFSQTQNYFEIQTNDGLYRIQPYSNKIIETSFIPNGENHDPNSHAVVLKPSGIRFKVIQNESSIELRTTGISVLIDKTPFQIRYTYKGKLLISERKGYLNNEANDILDFNLTEEEVLFGGGMRALGMNRRGNRLQLYNKAHYGYETKSELMNFSMPLVYSSRLYAIHFDNAPIGYLDLDSKNDNSLQYETISGRKTYQLVAAEDWMDLMDQYTNLTGKQPLMPRWALGNFSSRFGYHSQEETINTVDNFSVRF